MGSRALWRTEAGEGEPAVVLEAGRNTGAAAWRAVVPLLAPHVRVVAYDRAGIGGSDPAADPVVLGRQVSDLASVITSVASAPCVLAGHSWGGIVVQLLASRHPELVAGTVLVDPAHEQMYDVMPRPARWSVRVARVFRRRDELTGGDAAASAAMLRALRESPRAFPDVPVVVLSAASGFPRRFRARWTSLQAELAAAACDGRHIVVEGTGHDIPLERPGVVADAILDIVAQVRDASA